MPSFEVFIPAAPETGFDLTFRVDADNWMAALKTGLDQVGLQGHRGNLLCDIKPTGIDVTDPGSGKVFRIRELAEGEAPAAPAPAAAAAAPAAAAPAPAAAAPAAPAAVPEPPEPKTEVVAAPEPAFPRTAPPAEPPIPAPPQDTEPSLPAAPPTVAQPSPQSAAPAPQPPPPRPPSKRFSPPPHHSDTEVRSVSRVAQRAPTPAAAIGRAQSPGGSSQEDVLAELFERVQRIYDAKDADAALGFVLDLAMEKVPAESGSAYRADISSRMVRFVAARGPKADELMRLAPAVPVGTGLVGVSVEQGVGLAISDADQDPRFFRAVSDRLGYETRSVITVPIQREGQVMGALQLINRRQGSTFSESDLAIVDYLGRECAEYLRATGEVTA